MKRIVAVICVAVLILTACGSAKEDKQDVNKKQDQRKHYALVQTAVLPDESMYDGDTLLTTKVQTNWQGEPAIYQLRAGTNEDGEEYTALVEYSLNGDGNWQKKEYCKKALMKQIRNEVSHNIDYPFVQRGDDGNLYVLVKRFDDDPNPWGGSSDEKPYCAYSVLVIDEEKDSFREVRLQTKTTNEKGEEIDYAREYDVNVFHVMEDGTFFLAFSGASAMWFDGETGTQINLCPTIADSAFGKNVAFGESQIIYFSSANKRFGILDSDSLTVSSYFGDEISEENRKYEWYFDTDATTWQTYAFNQSGLYRISDFGKKASTIMLNSEGDFDDLANAAVYDVLVGTNEELYVLLRRQEEKGDDQAEDWQFAVVKYQAQ